MSRVALYIATHIDTGLKYFGKSSKWLTEASLQERYHGSGTHWKNHLKKHGDNVTMSIFGVFDEGDVREAALKFSYENNIVNSKEWANLKLEDGHDGGSIAGELHPCYGSTLSQRHKDIISLANTGKVFSEEHRRNIAKSRIGKSLTEETKRKISLTSSGKNNGFYGRRHTEETLKKLRNKTVSEEAREKLRVANSVRVICPHCALEGGIRAMNRYHFDNCKHKQKP